MTKEKSKLRAFISTDEVETKLETEKKKDLQKSFSQIIRELILGKKETK